MLECINCNNEIKSKSATKFCSKSCSASYNNSIKAKRKLEGKCYSCDKDISSTRKYCRDCLAIKRSEKTKNGKEYKRCKMCEQHLHHSLFYGTIEKSFSYCKSCEKIRVKNRQKIFKEKCVNYKGGQCSNCGYAKSLAALDFHHLDPSDKKFGIGAFSMKLNCWEKHKEIIQNELDKCILLCANCHRELHSH